MALRAPERVSGCRADCDFGSRARASRKRRAGARPIRDFHTAERHGKPLAGRAFALAQAAASPTARKHSRAPRYPALYQNGFKPADTALKVFLRAMSAVMLTPGWSRAIGRFTDSSADIPHFGGAARRETEPSGGPVSRLAEGRLLGSRREHTRPSDSRPVALRDHHCAPALVKH